MEGARRGRRAGCIRLHSELLSRALATLKRVVRRGVAARARTGGPGFIDLLQVSRRIKGEWRVKRPHTAIAASYETSCDDSQALEPVENETFPGLRACVSINSFWRSGSALHEKGRFDNSAAPAGSAGSRAVA